MGLQAPNEIYLRLPYEFLSVRQKIRSTTYTAEVVFTVAEAPGEFKAGLFAIQMHDAGGLFAFGEPAGDFLDFLEKVLVVPALR